MALNTGHFEGGVLIHQGEAILLHSPNVQLNFSGNDELRFGEKTGNAYLTTHRLIFLVGKSGHGNATFKSFSFPFVCLSEVDVEQPVFGSNFLKGKVRSQPDGGWRGEAKFKMVFKHGGAIDFAQGMVGAMRIAKQMNSQSSAWSAPPPSYGQATNGAHQAPPSYYSAPQNVYGWMPPAYNFPAPEAGTIFINDAPPPYPGMAPQQGQFPPQSPQGQAYSPQGQNYQQNGMGYPQQQQQQPYGAPQTGFGPTGTQNGFGGYPSTGTQNSFGYPQNGFGGYPPAGTQNGFGGYPPAGTQNGYAYANGNQAFIPASAPPSYDEARKKMN